MTIVWDIAAGFLLAAKCFLPLYSILLSTNYLGERDRAKDITYFQYVMLLLCTIGFAVMASNSDFGLLSNIFRIASFVMASVLGFVTLIFLGLNMYRKANKGGNKGSVMAALFVALYVVMIVFQPSIPEEADVNSVDEIYSVENVDGLGDGYSAGYEDGYADAYAAGYADGHLEAQQHSETYDDLLRQAYQATGGKGSGFRVDEEGSVFVEEHLSDGSTVWVPFEP